MLFYQDVVANLEVLAGKLNGADKDVAMKAVDALKDLDDKAVSLANYTIEDCEDTEMCMSILCGNGFSPEDCKMLGIEEEE